jgi:hypothetical protein
MRALVAARLHQISETDANIDEAVAEILGAAPGSDELPAKPFVEWCQAKGLPPRPAAPGSVALFVLQHEHLGIDALLAILAGISAAHVSLSLADPTTSWPVSAALNRLTGIEPPRSWPKGEKHRFLALPYTLQRYIADREQHRDREVRRMQNELATTRQQLTSLQKIVTGKADNSVPTEIKTGTEASA